MYSASSPTPSGLALLRTMPQGKMGPTLTSRMSFVKFPQCSVLLSVLGSKRRECPAMPQAALDGHLLSATAERLGGWRRQVQPHGLDRCAYKKKERNT